MLFADLFLQLLNTYKDCISYHPPLLVHYFIKIKIYSGKFVVLSQDKISKSFHCIFLNQLEDIRIAYIGLRIR